jgi:hypothetical protein
MILLTKAQRHPLFRLFRRDFPSWVTPFKRQNSTRFFTTTRAWTRSFPSRFRQFAPIVSRAALAGYRYFRGRIFPIRAKQVLSMSRARARSGSLRAISVASPAKPSIWSSCASAYRRANSGYFASH